MFTIEPGGYSGGDEELRSIGVLSSIGHGKQADFRVFDLEVFIWWVIVSDTTFGENVGIGLRTGELLSVDRFTTSAVSFCEVASLKHELRDDTVEARPFVTEAM